MEYSCIEPETFCPPVGSPEVQFNTSSGEWLFQTTDKVTYPPGNYDIVIEAFIRNYYDSSKQMHTFQLTLFDPCSLVTVSIPADSQTDPPDHTYSGTTSLTATYTASPPKCSLEYACKVPAASGTDLCAIGIMDPASGVFELSTTDKATYPPGSYQVDIEGSVSGHPTQSATHTFTYTFIDELKIFAN